MLRQHDMRDYEIVLAVDGDEFLMIEFWSVSFEASIILFRVEAVSVINSSKDCMKIHN